MKHVLFNGKTIDDAINKAILDLRITSNELEYVVVDKGSNGILGIGARPAVIEAWAKDTVMGTAQDLYDQVDHIACFDQAFLHFLLIRRCGASEYLAHVAPLLGELRAVTIRGEGHHVMPHQHLAIAVRPGTNADGGDAQ